MPTTTRRITNTIGTIPAATSLAGTVSTATVTTVLIYSGSEDIHDYVNEGNNGQQGFMYLFVPSGTPKLSKILGCYLNADGTTSITIETAITGLSGAACDLVIADLKGYSYFVDGGATATINSVSIEDGEGVSVPGEQFVSMGELQLPVYVDATGTDVLITETT